MFFVLEKTVLFSLLLNSSQFFYVQAPQGINLMKVLLRLIYSFISLIEQPFQLAAETPPPIM